MANLTDLQPAIDDEGPPSSEAPPPAADDIDYAFPRRADEPTVDDKEAARFAANEPVFDPPATGKQLRVWRQAHYCWSCGKRTPHTRKREGWWCTECGVLKDSDKPTVCAQCGGALPLAPTPHVEPDGRMTLTCGWQCDIRRGAAQGDQAAIAMATGMGWR